MKSQDIASKKENFIPLVVIGGIELIDLIIVSVGTAVVVKTSHDAIANSDWSMPHYNWDTEVDSDLGKTIIPPTYSELPFTQDALTFGSTSSAIITEQMQADAMTGTQAGTSSGTTTGTDTAVGTGSGSGGNNGGKKKPWWKYVLGFLGSIALLVFSLIEALGAFGVGLIAIILTLIIQSLRKWLISKKDEDEESKDTKTTLSSVRTRRRKIGFA